MIDHVEQVTGSLPYRTLKDRELSPVFYEAVQEYHDVLASGDLDVLLGFVVSEESALKVADNVYQLAVELNNGVKPSSLDVLPLDLYNTFTSEQLNFILMRELPADGSKRRKVYDDVLQSFRYEISDLIAYAYGLPSVDDESNSVTIKHLFEFTGLTKSQASKRVKILFAIKRAFNFAILVACTVAVVGSSVLLHLDGTLSAFGALILVPLFIVLSLMIFVDTDIKLTSKKHVPNTFGVFSESFKSMSEQYGDFIKPYLASMESYLLQENK